MTQQPVEHRLHSVARSISSTLIWLGPTSLAIYSVLSILTWFGIGIDKHWSVFGTDFAVTMIVFCVLLFSTQLAAVANWAIDLPDQVRHDISRTAALVSGVWVFLEHAVYGRLESITAPLFLSIWSVAVAVGSAPLIDRVERRWPFKYTWYACYGAVVFGGMAVQMAAQAVWGYGISRFATPVARLASGEPIAVALSLVGPPLVIAALLWAIFRRPSVQAPEALGRVEQGTRDNGLPLLSWTQHAGSLDTTARLDARGRFKIYLAMIAGGTLMGLPYGPGGMLFGLLLTAIVGSFGLRGADKLVMQGDTARLSPHVKTDEERLQETEPVTRYEKCAAYLDVSDNIIWFCVERGEYDIGEMRVVERVPWQSIGNFEEGSHREWFRSRVDVRDVRDWGVIIAQSEVGRVLLVAQSVDDRAWLIELLIKLQNTFIGPREAMLQAVADAAAAKPVGPAESRAAEPIRANLTHRRTDRVFGGVARGGGG